MLAAPGPHARGDRGTALTVRQVDGAPLEGTLKSLSFESGLVLDVDGEARTISAADVISLTRSDVCPVQAGNVESLQGSGRDGAIVELIDGDRVIGRLGSDSSDGVVLETTEWGTATVPMDRISQVMFSAAGMPAYADSLRWFRREASSADDRLLLTNGDVARGFITGLDREGVRLEIGGEKTVVPLRLAVAARLVHPPAERRAGQYAVVFLSDGQRMTLTNLAWSGDNLKASPARGGSVDLPADRVCSLSFYGGRWEWLSEKTPTSAEHTPMLSMEWRHQMDASVTGGQLCVAGVRYIRGIGVHSRSSLVFELNGDYREFVTSLGIDDESGSAADVSAAILVDGRQRFEKVHVVRGALLGPFRVDVAGARRLELLVDFGDNGDIQDRFDWIEPGLVR